MKAVVMVRGRPAVANIEYDRKSGLWTGAMPKGDTMVADTKEELIDSLGTYRVNRSPAPVAVPKKGKR